MKRAPRTSNETTTPLPRPSYPTLSCAALIGSALAASTACGGAVDAEEGGERGGDRAPIEQLQGAQEPPYEEVVDGDVAPPYEPIPEGTGGTAGGMEMPYEPGTGGMGGAVQPVEPPVEPPPIAELGGAPPPAYVGGASGDARDEH